MGYIKELRFVSGGYEFYFKFEIVKEYQEREFDNGKSFSGLGYSIYVLDCPDYYHALEHAHDYHFYLMHPRYWDETNFTPSICWDSNITEFDDANAVMFTWAKRFVKVYLNKQNISDYGRTEVPAGSFRSRKVPVIKEILEEIRSTIGKLPPETGGLLGTKDGKTVQAFYHDTDAKRGYDIYTPNIEKLNEIINDFWMKDGIQVLGFIHSHPMQSTSPSDADLEYAERIMQALNSEYFILPIVTSSSESEFKIHMYYLDKNRTLNKAEIDEIDDVQEPIIEKHDEDKPDFGKGKLSIAQIEEKFNETYSFKKRFKNQVFKRIESAYDIDYLSRCTVIGIGCGGARNLYLDLARMGVGNFILMDKDIIDETNIATQHAFYDEIGKNKVDVIKDKILLINKHAVVNVFNEYLEDSLDDVWVEKNLIQDVKNPVICAFTDDFMAQARLNRIAMKYEIPYISAQHHRYGETSEILYYYPKVSDYCPRCYLTNSRYKAYKDGWKNDVTSEGSPVFNTNHLNAIVEKLVIGLLLFKKDRSSKYCSFLNYYPKKNLLIIRQNSLINSDSSLNSLFAKHYDICFGDVLWIGSENKKLYPEGIVKCEDCDEKIEDTRIIFKK